MSGDEEPGDLWLKTFQEISVKLLAGTVVSSEGATHGGFASKMTHRVLGKSQFPTGCSVIPESFHKATTAWQLTSLRAKGE